MERHMTDPELLVLAAKAVGIEYIKDCVWIDNGFYPSPDAPVRVAWNPLVSDGDAMRMATKLRLDIMWSNVGVECRASGRRDLLSYPYAIEALGSNAGASVRRAIVRVAAQIGSIVK